MQEAAKKLTALPRLNRDWYRRHAAEGLTVHREVKWTADLTSLLRAYGTIRAKRTPPPVLTVDPGLLTSVDDALIRLRRMIGEVPDWGELRSFLPQGLQPGIQERSALAAAFVASLELAKDGRVRLRQDETYGPLLLAAREDRSDDG